MTETDPAGRIVPVILCGGSGTRLWPRSRPARPKPFLPLVGERTLFQQSLDRVADTGQFAPPIIVAGEKHVAPIREQASAADGARLIVEPAAKNTAPAIALAAASLPEDAVMLVCPSDHHIADPEAFARGAAIAAGLARQDYMVAFGIAPDAPETGYGYIRKGAAIEGGNAIAEFVEKPDRKTAEAYLASGEFVWNAGIFLFRAGAFLAELGAHRSDMLAAVKRALAEASEAEGELRPAAGPFTAIEGESVDYAVMENTRRAAVVAAEMGWSDIGSWSAVADARPADADGNSGEGRVDLVDCRNVRVFSDGPRVSVVGIEDAIVVVHGDEILVTSRRGAQAVGRLPGAQGR